MTARIRTMRESDITSVLAIERVCFPTPWSAGMFLNELLQSDTRHWVVIDSVWGVLGYAGLMQVEEEGHVMNLAVRPDARSIGLGAALLAELMAEAERRDISRLTLEVRPTNRVALHLYRGAGFTEAGINAIDTLYDLTRNPNLVQAYPTTSPSKDFNLVRSPTPATAPNLGQNYDHT